MAVKLISKKKVIIPPVSRMAVHNTEVKLISNKKKVIQFTGAGPYGCSYGTVFLNHIWHGSPFSKYTDVRGLIDLGTVAHQLRTNAIGRKRGDFFAKQEFWHRK